MELFLVFISFIQTRKNFVFGHFSRSGGLTVSRWRNLVSMHFFKVASFHVEIYSESINLVCSQNLLKNSYFYFLLRATTCVYLVLNAKVLNEWSLSDYTVFMKLLGKSPYSIQIRENTDQKNLRIWTFSAQW